MKLIAKYIIKNYKSGELKEWLLKWGTSSICGILLFKWGQAIAYTNCGYRAIGGEVFLLFIPIYLKLIEVCTRDLLEDMKRDERNADMPNM